MKSWEGMRKIFYNITASGRDIAPITLRDDYRGLERVQEGTSPIAVDRSQGENNFCCGRTEEGNGTMLFAKDSTSQ
jgi:hypothetical protein